MTRMLLAIMALVVGVAFSAPAFADDTKKPAEEKKADEAASASLKQMGC